MNNGNKIPVNTRNSAVLASFIEYCWSHPHQRFWQALASWANSGIKLEKMADGGDCYVVDPFYWEGKDK